MTLDGRKDILGLWAGTGGEGAKFWMSVLLDMKNRGVRDVFFLVCDGLKGLPAVVSKAGLYRGERRRGPGGPGRPGGEVGRPLRGDHPAVENAWEEFIPFLDYDIQA